MYCCFSKYESSPLSVWEAMHQSLPIITTDVGDLKHHINKGKFGYVIKKFDEKIYASKIIEILNNKHIYNKLKLASYDYSRKNFNRDKNFKKLLEFVFSNK